MTILDQDDVLALIQMAQANLNKITAKFIADVEQSEMVDQEAEALAEKTIAELLKKNSYPMRKPNMMTPEEAQQALKQRAG